MEQALKTTDGLCTPDVIKSALDHKSEGSRISETTIDSLFGVPDKILIPERYIPDTVSHGHLYYWTAMSSYFLLTGGQHEAGTWDPNYTPGPCRDGFFWTIIFYHQKIQVKIYLMRGQT